MTMTLPCVPVRRDFCVLYSAHIWNIFIELEQRGGHNVYKKTYRLRTPSNYNRWGVCKRCTLQNPRHSPANNSSRYHFYTLYIAWPRSVDFHMWHTIRIPCSGKASVRSGRPLPKARFHGCETVRRATCKMIDTHRHCAPKTPYYKMSDEKE